MKVLFLLRKNVDSASVFFNSATLTPENAVKSSGLFNSALMTKDQLIKHLGIIADLKVIDDANSIDREVTVFKPEVCVIEALWVTPEKLAEVAALHPKISFVVRLHSEIPFLSSEAIAIDWIQKYFKISNVLVTFNSHNAFRDFSLIYDTLSGYLPNIYDDIKITYPNLQERIRLDGGNGFIKATPGNYTKKFIDVGCFGAVRLMKNQLFQGFVAIQLANMLGKKLRFHVNASRREHGGESVITNLRALFAASDHELVEHEWLSRADFLLLVDTMDIGMQLSFNESFNIVTADFVAREVPIVVSDSIDWMPKITRTSPNNSIEALERMLYALYRPNKFAYLSQVHLNRYNVLSTKSWQDHLNNIHLV